MHFPSELFLRLILVFAHDSNSVHYSGHVYIQSTILLFLERISNICIYFFKLSDEADKKSTEKITTPYMTKYERARVLGTRALQIGMNFALNNCISFE